MRIYLVRHGQTAWNKELVFRGQADVPLDELGRRQAECAAEALRGAGLAAVYASPLSRARETAEAIARRHGLSVQVDPAFNDFDCGEFEGLALDEARRRFPEVCQVWETAPHRVRFPGGGTLDDVTQRAMPRLEALARRHAGQSIAVVSHRVVLKVVLCQALWGDNSHFWEVALDTASITLLEHDGSGFRVVEQNATAHLAKLKAEQDPVDF